ncbi:hypothetical protein LEL_02488 [Akanthomyces lecanii RCEF 1005]|uniref:Tetratricopeptide-like helical n=1 Tax=Akanthomyces lecanii RCEF 1005 TaxID=1081108 RepID=A0A162K7M1_CORDF|nr:hypothetical protein LEL_02488 [Akanthomyces lecanii RCEF 1005]
MAESEKTPQGPESEKRQLGIEAEQQQQAYQNRTPDLETTEWMAAQLAEIEVISAGGKFHEALQLLDAGLAKLQGRHDVRLWESMLLSKKHLLLNQIGRPKDAQVVKDSREQLRETFEEWSRT